MRKMKQITTGAVDTENGVSCSECGRSFPSMKALFGHMRCHPERNYRGMNSSNTKKRLKMKPEIDHTNPNFPKLGINPDRKAQTWIKTGKRGRPEVSKSPQAESTGSTTEEEEEEEKEAEVFDALIILHRGDHQPSPTNRKEDKETSSSSSEMQKAMIEAETNDDFIEDMMELMKGGKCGSKSTNPNPIEIGNLAEFASTDQHTCHYCGRSFPTHQALGGHISSHKLKMTIVNTLDEDEFGKKHICKICKKNFGSGQALGGHMRTHVGEDQNGGGENSNEEKKLRKELFDLNKMPEGDDEDDE